MSRRATGSAPPGPRLDAPKSGPYFGKNERIFILSAWYFYGRRLSTSMYGGAGAHGVILITTKRDR